MSQRKDHTGKIYNNLKCLKFIKSENNNSFWEVKCLLCGTIKESSIGKITSGHTKSCGCLKRIDNTLYCQKRLYEQCINGAKDRNIMFDLTFKDFISFLILPCFYCGDKEIATYKHSRNHSHTLKYNGIDHLDSSKGYTKENIRPCCKICNWMKNDLTMDEFLGQIAKIAQKQKRILANYLKSTYNMKGVTQ